MNRFVYCRIIAIITILALSLPASAQVGLGVDMTPSLRGKSKGVRKEKKLKNPFIHHLSIHVGIDYAALRRLQKTGYGKTELIKLILISREAGLPLAELVEKRRKRTRIKSIAEDAGTDYRKIRREARRIKTEVESSMEEIPVTEEEPLIEKEKKSNEKD